MSYENGYYLLTTDFSDADLRHYQWIIEVVGDQFYQRFINANTYWKASSHINSHPGSLSLIQKDLLLISGPLSYEEFMEDFFEYIL